MAVCTVFDDQKSAGLAGREVDYIVQDLVGRSMPRLTRLPVHERTPKCRGTMQREEHYGAP